ncbi:MAG: hypothetical protein V4488_06095 [Pseudomonadota bacterium]
MICPHIYSEVGAAKQIVVINLTNCCLNLWRKRLAFIGIFSILKAQPWHPRPAEDAVAAVKSIDNAAFQALNLRVLDFGMAMALRFWMQKCVEKR